MSNINPKNITMWDKIEPESVDKSSSNTENLMDSESSGRLSAENKYTATDLQTYNTLGPKVDPPRLVIVQSISYQPLPGEGEPHVYSDGFVRKIFNPEQVYERETKLSGKVNLDTGWVINGKTLIVYNQEGRNLQKIPSPQEMEELEKRVIHIFIGDSKSNMIIVPPRQSVVLPVYSTGEIKLFFPQPHTKIRYIVIPE